MPGLGGMISGMFKAKPKIPVMSAANASAAKLLKTPNALFKPKAMAQGLVTPAHMARVEMAERRKLGSVKYSSMRSEIKKLAPKSIKFLKGRGIMELSPGSMRLVKTSKGLPQISHLPSFAQEAMKKRYPALAGPRSSSTALALRGPQQVVKHTPVMQHGRLWSPPRMSEEKLRAAIRARGGAQAKPSVAKGPQPAATAKGFGKYVAEGTKSFGKKVVEKTRKHGPGLARAGLIGGGALAGGAALGLSTILSRHAEQQMRGPSQFYHEQ